MPEVAPAKRRPSGHLIVFEGPDESGKTTVSKLLAEEVFRRGLKSLWLAFPGHEPGTLGAEIYALHHDARFAGVPAVSLQLLHVAAHIEALQRSILPALAAGTTVVLDRYWWSTWVYGLAAGAGRRELTLAVEIERAHWQTIRPAVGFLFQRDLPGVKKQPAARETLNRYYLQLARRERRHHPVEIIRNGASVEDALHAVVSKTFEHCSPA